jgi:hypothetical protein
MVMMGMCDGEIKSVFRSFETVFVNHFLKVFGAVGSPRLEILQERRSSSFGEVQL